MKSACTSKWPRSAPVSEGPPRDRRNGRGREPGHDARREGDLRLDHEEGPRGRRCGESARPGGVRVREGPLSDNVIGGLSDGDLSSSGSPSKSRRLSFKGMGSRVAAQMLPDGMKSLAPSGAAVVGHARSLAVGPGIPPCFPGPLLVEDLSSVGWRSARSQAIESAAVGVERRPVNRLIALATRPRRVATAVTEAGLMPDQHFAGGRRCVRWGRRSVGG